MDCRQQFGDSQLVINNERAYVGYVGVVIRIRQGDVCFFTGDRVIDLLQEDPVSLAFQGTVNQKNRYMLIISQVV
jgi:hypothetical protein